MTATRARELLTAPGMPFEMDECEIHGRRVRVWRHATTSLRTMVENSRQYGDRDFIRYGEERVSYARHFDLVAALGQRLIDEYGVRPGDRVAIAMRNYPEWPVAFFASAVVGAVAVPLNAWWTAPELRFALQDSGASVLIADGQRAESLSADGDISVPTVVVRPENTPVSGMREFPELLGDVARAEQLPGPEPEPDDLATLFYTSGTTGQPKAALGTHRNLCTNPVSVAYGAALAGVRAGMALEDLLTGPERRVSLLPVPLFHVTGCHAVLAGNAANGGTLVLMHKWNAAAALELIEQHRVTHFTGVPAQASQMCGHPDATRRDLSSMATAGSGGAPAPPSLQDRMAAIMPTSTFSNGYGLTETSSVASINAGINYRLKPDSVGPPIAVVDAKVLDEAGEELRLGEVGELWLSGPNVVRGYWNRPESTAEAIIDGWLRSGDLAYLDDDGFIYVVDRAKDMVIRGGENVYSAEVEAAVFEHPDVLDCAVIGIAHEELGEEVGAVVQPQPGSGLTADGLREFVHSRIAGFKVPAHVWLREDDMPRNAAGKLLKREVRAQVLGS